MNNEERIEGRRGGIYTIDGKQYLAIQSTACYRCVASGNKELCRKLPVCMLGDFETSLIYLPYGDTTEKA